MLGLLRKTCPLLNAPDLRRTLYHSVVKSQLCFAAEVWHRPSLTIKFSWKEFKGAPQDGSFKLGTPHIKIVCELLPLAYDREVKDLIYFFKLLNGFYDLNVSNFVSFVSHNRTRNCQNPSLVLKVSSRKTSTFQSSFLNRIVPLWNYVCKIACPADLCSLTMFKSFLSRTYVELFVSSIDEDMPCTWSLYRSCSCHKTC